MAFVDDVRHYVNLSQAHAWRVAAPDKPDEPALVSSFLSKDMYRGLREVLRKHIPPTAKVLVKGIFTHQTPKILPAGAPKSVEMGDLMFVHQHYSTGRRKTVSGRALLLQAKRTMKPKTGSLNSGNQKIQFNLYQKWPTFKGTLRLAEFPNNGTVEWDFNQPSASTESATSGADYLTVFNGHAFQAPTVNPAWTATLSAGPQNPLFVAGGFPKGSTWSTGSVNPALSAKMGVTCSEEFAEAFERFLNGRSGRAFDPTVNKGSDHWSIFVNEMLNCAARPNGNYTYTSSNQGVVSGMRGRNLHLFAALPALHFSFEEELDSWMDSGTPSGFEFTNAVLRHTREFANEAPPRHGDGDVQIPTSGSGHVPILYVATIGDEPKLLFSPDTAFVPRER